MASKDLLKLEHKKSSTSALESALLVCDNKDSSSQSEISNPDKKPSINPVAKSQVLDKVKGFLGVISEANKKLQVDSTGNMQDYDIEVLTGNESEVIEMDLMLGIADLHTQEAVRAAESAITGNQPVIPLAASSDESETDDDSDDSDGDDEDSVGNETGKRKQSKKRQRIVELS